MLKVLESGEAVAKQTKKIITNNNITASNINPNYDFYCNGSDRTLKKILPNNFKNKNYPKWKNI